MALPVRPTIRVISAWPARGIDPTTYISEANAAAGEFPLALQEVNATTNWVDLAAAQVEADAQTVVASKDVVTDAETVVVAAKIVVTDAETVVTAAELVVIQKAAEADASAASIDPASLVHVKGSGQSNEFDVRVGVSGLVLPFATTSAPDGWLKCNGAHWCPT